MTDALLLELEGVVVDTEPLWRDALAGTLAEHATPVADDELQSGKCTPVRERIERLLAAHRHTVDETTLDLMVLGATRRFSALLRRGMTLVPGARDLLEDARQRARVAVVTRARRADADVMLSLAGLETLVEFVIAAEDAAPKPSSASYERALTRLQRRCVVRRDAVLALEDGESGARAAVGAGLRCIVVCGALAARDLDSLAESLDRQAERVG
ncbi:MAG TPA: HAD family phosphatase [Gemmatimonadaceae bacterium]|jgi:beta-phosphoglucomutase-like phosphatase (HAD superfamily)|nr:HAD family phosphatase [Gemmatimonadaceae bacterium]